MEGRSDIEILCATSENPNAAKVLVDLLQAIEGLPLDQALVVESLAYGMLQGGAEHARWRESRRPSGPRPAGAVRLERRDSCLTIMIDRPASLNSIDRKLRDELYEAFTLASLDREIRRVELRSVGRSFCVGADLSEFGTTRDPATAHAIRMQTLPARAIIGCHEKLFVHVQGACVGAGLEMAAFAHRVTASARAWFQLPELSMGLIPGAGGCVSVSRRIGWERTARMILTGRRISARTALDWGLVDAIVDDCAGDDGRTDEARRKD